MPITHNTSFAYFRTKSIPVQCPILINILFINVVTRNNKTISFIFQPFSFQASLNNAQNRRRRREQELAEREQLLSRRFGPGHDHTVTVDFLAQEQQSLHSSHRNVDEMLHTGKLHCQKALFTNATLIIVFLQWYQNKLSSCCIIPKKLFFTTLHNKLCL